MENNKSGNKEIQKMEIKSSIEITLYYFIKKINKLIINKGEGEDKYDFSSNSSL